jgi:hypothetical protein
LSVDIFGPALGSYRERIPQRLLMLPVPMRIIFQAAIVADPDLLLGSELNG